MGAVELWTGPLFHVEEENAKAVEWKTKPRFLVEEEDARAAVALKTIPPF